MCYINKLVLIVIWICCFAYATISAQSKLSLFAGISNTQLIGKTPKYSLAAKNSISDFYEKEPFYGSLNKITNTLHKNFGLIYTLPQTIKKINLGVIIGVYTYGHKEVLNGGRSEDYHYGFRSNPFMAGDTNIIITNKFYSYLCTIGINAEMPILHKLKAELQLTYALPNSISPKLFRSIFNTHVTTNDLGEAKSQGVLFKDFSTNGIVFLQGGINYQVTKKFKLHALTSISITPVNKYVNINRLQYSSLSLQLSYVFLKQPSNEDDV